MVHTLLERTLGGLTKAYYFRQVFFGILVSGLLITVLRSSEVEISIGGACYMLASTLLYPYSRFIYETVYKFIVGDVVFFSGALLFLAAKMCTMLMCWALALFIAPFGLVYLWYVNVK